MLCKHTSGRTLSDRMSNRMAVRNSRVLDCGCWCNVYMTIDLSRESVGRATKCTPNAHQMHTKCTPKLRQMDMYVNL